jgi:hypothetical protein
MDNNEEYLKIEITFLKMTMIKWTDTFLLFLLAISIVQG